MRVLVLTQVVDQTDPVLGFFHGWLKTMATEFEVLTVVCLRQGDFSLPTNVTVLSLGKERKVSRWQYLRNFYQYIWQRRHEYDAVFVHMNEEYVLLGGLLWKMWGKKIVLWRNHQYGTVLTRLAVALSDQVLCTSPHSFTAQFSKTTLCSAGIDTDFFTLQTTHNFAKPIKILLLGRISQIKNIAILLDEVSRASVPVVVTIVGAPATQADTVYFRNLQRQFAALEEEKKIQWVGGCTQSEARDFFATHDMYVNATNSGSLDKTILEAMSSGCLPLMANTSFTTWLPEAVTELIIFEPKKTGDLARALAHLASLPPAARLNLQTTLREWVEQEQSLRVLMAQISQKITA